LEPPEDKPADRKIVVISDLRVPHEHRASVERVALFIAEHRPDEVLLVGQSILDLAYVDQLHETLTLFRSAHGCTAKMHLDQSSRTELALLSRNGLVLLTSAHQLATGWISLHGEEGRASGFPGGKAIGLARALGVSVVCGTGGHGVIGEVAGPANSRTALFGIEAGNLSNDQPRHGFTLLRCLSGHLRPTLISIDRKSRLRTAEFPAS
jgi:hypothetical protein